LFTDYVHQVEQKTFPSQDSYTMFSSSSTKIFTSDIFSAQTFLSNCRN